MKPFTRLLLLIANIINEIGYFTILILHLVLYYYQDV